MDFEILYFHHRCVPSVSLFVYLPDELAEGLVVGQGAVVFLGEDVVDILHAPVIEQLGRRLGLLQETNNHKLH